MTVAAVRTVDAIGVVVAEPAMLDEEVIAAFARVVGDPYAAFEMLHPAVADDGVRAETVLETLTYLIGAVAVIVPLVIDGIEVQSLDAEAAGGAFYTAVGVGGLVVAGSIEVYLRVPHACADELRVVAVSEVQTSVAHPSSFGEVDDLTRIGGDEVLHVRHAVVLDLIAGKALEGHSLRYRLQLCKIDGVRRGVIVGLDDLEVLAGGYGAG